MSVTPEARRGSVTVVGTIVNPHVGMTVLLIGDWVNNDTYGKQFKVSKYQITTPSSINGLFLYLSGGAFPGIGEGMARKIIDKFGEETIKVIENEPDRLLEIPRFGEARKNKFVKRWQEQRALNDIMVFLQKYNISTKLATRIYHEYGDKTLGIIETNPYILADEIDGISFARADQIGLSMGIEPDSTYRITAAINHVLKVSSDGGNTYDTITKVSTDVSELINVQIDRVIDVLEEMVENEKLAKIASMLFLPLLKSCESNIATHISTLISMGCDDSIATDKEISLIEKELGITYNEKQREALKNGVANNIFVITGGPGTGKTTLIRGLIKLFEKRRMRIKCAAPTGKAADRMSEATGMEAKTVHRMLKYGKDGGSFYSRGNNPLPTDVLILDEVSMMNVPLMNSLLKSLSFETKLILVGDIDQLPCIGPGNILSDIITSGMVPYVKLDHIFRQEGTSEIILAAHEINNGKAPVVTNGKNSDFFFLSSYNGEESKGKIIDLITKRLPAAYGYSPTEIQAIAPMKDGIVGVNALNTALQDAINPNGEEVKWGGFTKFKKNDKVMQTKNNYTKDVFNGEYGIITSVDNEERLLTVSYKNRDITYEYTELDELMLAYAITVHKSQGSEYPVVVMPITRSHYTMLKRNLVYTGITRAKKLCVLVGDGSMLGQAARTQDTVKRKTYLNNFIKESACLNSSI
jgi:exodeoxyribonuclease V alpha subunit